MKDGRSPHLSVGIDLVEYTKARMLWRSGGQRLRRVLSPDEWNYVSRSKTRDRALAEILAAKEAVFKTLDQPWMGPENFRNIRIQPGRGSRLTYRLGSSWKRASVNQAGAVRLTRTDRYVVATCAGI